MSYHFEPAAHCGSNETIVINWAQVAYVLPVGETVVDVVYPHGFRVAVQRHSLPEAMRQALDGEAESG